MGTVIYDYEWLLMVINGFIHYILLKLITLNRLLNSRIPTWCFSSFALSCCPLSWSWYVMICHDMSWYVMIVIVIIIIIIIITIIIITIITIITITPYIILIPCHQPFCIFIFEYFLLITLGMFSLVYHPHHIVDIHTWVWIKTY